MITVRYPSGFSIQYNSANHVKWYHDRWDLYEQEGGRWVASLSPGMGVLIEVMTPCRTYNAARAEADADLAVVRRKLDRAKATIRRLKAKP